MNWRTSRVTGMRDLPGWGPLGGGTVLLYDGAEAVPVHETDSYEAMVTTRMGDGQLRCSYVRCGPAAHLPMAYREYTEPGPLPDTMFYVFEQRDASTVSTWRQVVDHADLTRTRLTEAELWGALRDQYAWALRERDRNERDDA